MKDKIDIKPLTKIVITDPLYHSPEQIGQTLTVKQDLGEFWLATSELGYYYRVEKWQAKIIEN